MCQGQLLCKVSSSQLPLLQRNEVYSQTRRKSSRLDANCGRTDERTNGRKVEPLYRTLLKAGAIKINLETFVPAHTPDFATVLFSQTDIECNKKFVENTPQPQYNAIFGVHRNRLFYEYNSDNLKALLTVSVKKKPQISRF